MGGRAKACSSNDPGHVCRRLCVCVIVCVGVPSFVCMYGSVCRKFSITPSQTSTFHNLVFDISHHVVLLRARECRSVLFLRDSVERVSVGVGERCTL